MPTVPAAGATVHRKFTTRALSTGVPTTLAGTPAISIYKDGSTTESTAGVTLTVDFDSRTGLNHVAIDTSADGTFYANESRFYLVVTAGTVGGTSVVGEVVGEFDLAAAIGPTTGGVNVTQVAGQTAAASGTVTFPGTIASTTNITAASGVTLAAVTHTGAVIPTVTNVTNAVTAGTVNDKTGYALSSGGIDNVVIEAGCNLRQAVAIIGSAVGGVSSGVDTGSPVFKGLGVTTTRISATASAGNRSVVTLTLP